MLAWHGGAGLSGIPGPRRILGRLHLYPALQEIPLGAACDRARGASPEFLELFLLSVLQRVPSASRCQAPRAFPALPHRRNCAVRCFGNARRERDCTWNLRTRPAVRADGFVLLATRRKSARTSPAGRLQSPRLSTTATAI